MSRTHLKALTTREMQSIKRRIVLISRWSDICQANSSKQYQLRNGIGNTKPHGSFLFALI